MIKSVQTYRDIASVKHRFHSCRGYQDIVGISCLSCFKSLLLQFIFAFNWQHSVGFYNCSWALIYNGHAFVLFFPPLLSRNLWKRKKDDIGFEKSSLWKKDTQTHLGHTKVHITLKKTSFNTRKYVKTRAHYTLSKAVLLLHSFLVYLKGKRKSKLVMQRHTLPISSWSQTSLERV